MLQSGLQALMSKALRSKEEKNHWDCGSSRNQPKCVDESITTRCLRCLQLGASWLRGERCEASARGSVGTPQGSLALDGVKTHLGFYSSVMV